MTPIFWERKICDCLCTYALIYRHLQNGKNLSFCSCKGRSGCEDRRDAHKLINFPIDMPELLEIVHYLKQA